MATSLKFMFLKLNTRNSLFFALLSLSTLTFGLSATTEAQDNCHREILITIEREACFGSCPVYSAKIYADGTVTYIGKDFVKAVGERQYKISEDRVKELVSAFAQIKYFSLRDKYATDENGNSLTCQPTTTTSICVDGKHKKVVNYYSAPKELAELENAIERIAGLNYFIGPL